MPCLEERSKEELIKLIAIYAKNWLAHDGCWFLAAEEKYGLDAAIALDVGSWERFTVVEAKRIMAAFDIPEMGGLPALADALGYRLYATVNEQEVSFSEDGRLMFTMKACRVQEARRRKNLPDFPCRSVGLVEYAGFASTIDPRIRTRCIYCPPDTPDPHLYCQWEFTLPKEEAAT